MNLILKAEEHFVEKMLKTILHHTPEHSDYGDVHIIRKYLKDGLCVVLYKNIPFGYLLIKKEPIEVLGEISGYEAVVEFKKI